MKTLVTGATGFIGSHLVDALIKERYGVRALVRHTSDIKGLKENGVGLFYDDLRDRKSLHDITQGVEIVFHLAAQVDKAGIGLQEYESVNVEGTRNLVQACLGSAIKKFVFYSSIAAIGIRNMGKVDESLPPAPHIVYGKAKRKAEVLLLSYYKDCGFPALILRPPTVYGIGEKYNFLTLCKAIKNGYFMTIGSGENLIDFCWVGNIIQATILAGKTGKQGSIYHVADARPYTMNKVAQTIATIEGVRLPRFHLPAPIAYCAAFLLGILGRAFKFRPLLYPARVRTMTSNFYYDISKAREELGFKPADDFERFFKRTINYYRDNNLL